MQKRGPDGAGLWISPDERIGLAHRRLSIIDLSEAGAQPMALFDSLPLAGRGSGRGSNAEGMAAPVDRAPTAPSAGVRADGNLRIVFNGEIYNYRELRDRLQGKDHHFRSHSDTEVLLHAWREYGQDMVHHLRGMFAFALWDEEKKGLFLARDHFGIKPLYYHDDGRTFRAASQVKALLAGGGIETHPEPAGHVGFYLWGCVPEPYTLYRNLFSLPAGHTLWVDRCGPRTPRKYFDIAEELETASNSLSPLERVGVRALRNQPSAPSSEAQEALKEALKDSVKHHLIADVPVGIFLSSGLDSATIAALASEEIANPLSQASSLPLAGGGAGWGSKADDTATFAGFGAVRPPSQPSPYKGEGAINPLQAITLGFTEYANTQNDEVPLAKVIAARHGCAHHISLIARQDFDDELPAILHAMDQPSIDGVNTYFVARAAAQAGMKVALSGLGGDELLGGYPSFRQIPKLVSAVRPLASMPGLGCCLRVVSAPFVKRSTSPKYASLFEYGGSYGGAYLLRRGLFMPWELPNFLDGDFVREGWVSLQPVVRLNEWVSRVSSPYAKVVAMEMACYMRNMLLRDSDWAGMAHSLEIRLPMVDIEVFRALAPYLPDSVNRPVKPHLGNVPQLALPREILDRPKTGFSLPVQEWVETQEYSGKRGLRGWAMRVHGSVGRTGHEEKDHVEGCAINTVEL
ncbi:MAG: asparagine synthase-related protein [Methylococcaceae bacterium]|nr:asparagine synthase-related protein [Methylococcaceae bacterium]